MVMACLSKAAADGSDKRVEVDEVIADHVPHDREVDFVVAVDEDVAEPRQVTERGGKRRLDPAKALHSTRVSLSVNGLAIGPFWFRCWVNDSVSASRV